LTQCPDLEISTFRNLYRNCRLMSLAFREDKNMPRIQNRDFLPARCLEVVG
jgi:hypothetical protein